MRASLTRMDLFYYGLSRLLKMYFFFMIIMFLFRLIFTLYFSESSVYQEFMGDLVYAFYMGARYDTMVASYLLALPYVLFSVTAMMGSRMLMNFSIFLSSAFLYVMFLIVFFILVSDLGFYSFFQDHLNILFFGFMEDDTKAVLSSIWKNYPLGYAIIGFFIYIYFQLYIFKKTFKFLDQERSVFSGGFFKVLFSFSFFLVLLAGGARGSFTTLVLSPKYADFSKNEFVNQVALNGVITFEKAIKLRKQRTSLNFNMADHMGYGKNIHQAFSDHLGFDTSPTSKEHLVTLLERKTGENPKLDEMKPHVVVLVMESFGTFWTRYNSAEFNFMGDLTRHFAEDYYFENFISSDNGTIGSLMAVATNIPNRPGARFLSESRYMQMPLRSGSHIPYKERGYETRFIYGGKLGWRGIGKYFKYQKFHQVEGESHIVDTLKLEGNVGTEWGAYDEYFFEYIYKKLETSKVPQFMLGLSTTNHPPFEVHPEFKAPPLTMPENLQKRVIREEELIYQRFKAYQYANFKLAEFIQRIKDSPLGKKTIIAVTGDHNFWGFINYTKEETYEKYKVPFYIYVPEELKPGIYDKQKFGSHEDIMPTLYNLSLSKTSYLAFGRDLFGYHPSYSLNGGIYAGSEGMFHNGKYYKWKKNSTMINLDENIDPISDLTSYWKSTLTVADYFLRDTWSKRSQASDNKEDKTIH
jgi:phosphoglycerol transferase MdoB-like AlkP superfamily enzyme